MCRYVASELASDIIISIGDIKFYLHKVCPNPVTISGFQLRISKISVNKLIVYM